ncbi:MAG: ATP-binding protein [bacterium]|nr:ATP-binding protein [bacterium]
MGSKKSGQPLRLSEQTPVLVDEHNFLEAIRDAGYRNAAVAIAELVDNAIEAGATTVEIEVTSDNNLKFPVQISVTDDGRGMSPKELQRALVFGGSSRFGSRDSFGRFGMGLPSASLSLARDIEVVSWRGSSIRTVRLSLDDRNGFNGQSVRSRRLVRDRMPTPSGTRVLLRSCDRHGYERPGWLSRSIAAELGRVFRRQLESDLCISVNGDKIPVREHLLLKAGATLYGDMLRYQIDGPGGGGQVRVQFSELPVLRWSTMSSSEKAAMGIPSTKPISILRAGREIDRGWWFMGSKRRENYDSWWRCELDFDPNLDEWFGVSYTKQGIQPVLALKDLLTPDLEAIARSMNSRVRSQFDLVKIADPIQVAERTVQSVIPVLPDALGCRGGKKRDIRVALGETKSPAAFEVRTSRSVETVTLNICHPLIRDLYAPLASSDLTTSKSAAARVALVALAGALIDTGAWPVAGRAQAWSDVVATLLERCP